MRKNWKIFLCVSMAGMLMLFAGCGKKSEDDVTNTDVYGELSPLTDEELEEMEASGDEDLTQTEEPDDTTGVEDAALDDSAQEKQEE